MDAFAFNGPHAIYLDGDVPAAPGENIELSKPQQKLPISKELIDAGLLVKQRAIKIDDKKEKAS